MDETPLQALAAFGVSDDVIEEVRQHLRLEQAAATQPVWPQNWHAVKLFLALSTQWQVVGGFGAALFAGLRYEAVPVVQSAVKAVLPSELVRPWPEVFGKLQAIEAAALKAMNS